MPGGRPQKHKQTNPSWFKPNNGGPSKPSFTLPVVDKPATRSVTAPLQSASKFDENEYIICKISKVEQLWNTAFLGHKRESPNCKGQLKMTDKSRKIISTSWTLTCSACEYKSKRGDMFDSHKTCYGGYGSTLNQALGLALIGSPIGGQVLRELFTTLGIDPGSESGIQKLINRSGEICHKLATDNTAQVRKETLVGVKEAKIEADAKWNNKLFANSPFQGGTQRTFIAVENMTEEKKIVNFDLESCICYKCTRLVNGGVVVDDVGQHAGHCSATTLKRSGRVGQEAISAGRTAELFKNEGIDLTTFTSDGDSLLSKKIQETYPDCIWLQDSHHYSKTVKGHISKGEFSAQMFPGTTKTTRTKEQNWFAEDLRQRCEAEHKRAIGTLSRLTNLNEKKEKLKQILSNTPEAIIKCYKGSCDLCLKHSFVCKGPGSDYQWPKAFMSSSSKNNLHPTEEDETLLKSLILDRLGPKALSKTFLGSTTQKSESVMRALEKTNPKSVTSVRNFPGRVGAGVLHVNKGLGGTIRSFHKASKHRVSKNVGRIIHKMDVRKKKRKLDKKKPEVKRKRVNKRARELREYESRNRNLLEHKEDYKKGIASEHLRISKPSTSKK